MDDYQKMTSKIEIAKNAENDDNYNFEGGDQDELEQEQIQEKYNSQKNQRLLLQILTYSFSYYFWVTVHI